MAMLAPIATFHPVLVLTAVGAEPSGLYAALINTFFFYIIISTLSLDSPYLLSVHSFLQFITA